MRLRSLLALFAALALVATACGGDGESAPEGFRIGIVAPSAQNDLAFTQSIVDAANALSGDPEILISDGLFVVDDAASAIRGYANDGVDLVIAHGSQYGGSVEQIAKDFPNTIFAWGTAANTFGLPNVYAYEAASDEGGYVMGLMAAQLTTTGNIGIVGPIEVGDAKLYVDGFQNGAEAGGATVNKVYTGSFSDVALAQQAAEAFASQNVDVMSGTAQMVVGAVGVARTEGILWFGTQSNQSSLGDIVVASQVYKWEVVLEQILKDINDGIQGGKSYVIDFENEGIVLEYNDDYELPGDVKDLAEETIEGIKDGSISTGA